MRRADARKLAFGLPLGVPTNCQLGGLAVSGRFCSHEAVGTVGKIRICAKHLRRLMKIAAEADPEFAARHPVSSGFLRVAP